MQAGQVQQLLFSAADLQAMLTASSCHGMAWHLVAERSYSGWWFLSVSDRLAVVTGNAASEGFGL